MFDWFKRAGAPQEQGAPPPPQSVEAPPGEAEAIFKIQKLCWVAGISAETVAGDRSERMPDHEFDRYERDRYHRLRSEAVALADTLTDEFYRNAAIHYLAELCMKAGDVSIARVLFSRLEIDFMRAQLLEKYPAVVPTTLADIMRA